MITNANKIQVKFDVIHRADDATPISDHALSAIPILQTNRKGGNRLSPDVTKEHVRAFIRRHDGLFRRLA
jgi:hypothetical protein